MRQVFWGVEKNIVEYKYEECVEKPKNAEITSLQLIVDGHIIFLTGKNSNLEDVSEKVIRTEQKVLKSRETRVRGVSIS